MDSRETSSDSKPESKSGFPLDYDSEERGPRVTAPLIGSLEAVAKTLPAGPFYAELDEREEWRDLSDQAPDDDLHELAKTFNEEAKLPVARRDFLKLFSMSGVAAGTACVRRPVEKAIPYVEQPVDLVQGTSVLYATTCGMCSAACGVMVKTREGRPVKLEGLSNNPVNSGHLCALGQGAIQGLYHPERRKNPQIKTGDGFKETSWDSAYKSIAEALGKSQRVGIVCGATTGHRLKFFKDFLKLAGGDSEKVYTLEANGLMESITKAHELAFGLTAIPRPDMQHADLIVGIGSDFLDLGVSPVYQQRSFTSSHGFRGAKKGKFVQFESTMTLTGGKADQRHTIPNGTETLTALTLVRALLEHPENKVNAHDRGKIEAVLSVVGSQVDTSYEQIGVPKEVFIKLADDLLKTKSVVMCGGSSNFDENATLLQLAAIFCNSLIGSYEQVLKLQKGWMNPPVNTGDFARFLSDAQNLDVLFVIDANPAFAFPKAFGIESLLQNIKTVVSIQPFPNETDALATLSLPGHHYLESWGDEQPVVGFWALRQPAVRPMTNSRQGEDSLLWVLAHLEKPLPYQDYQTYLRKNWQKVYDLIAPKSDFDTFFQAVQHRGYVGKVAGQAVGPIRDLAKLFALKKPPSTSTLSFIAPLDGRLRDGRGAHLPILQEIGDSLTTITWDSWAAMSPDTARNLGVKRNDLIQVTGPAAATIEVAVYPMPGIAANTIVVPRGNGRRSSGTIENGVGVDPLLILVKTQDPLTGLPATSGQEVKVVNTGKKYRLAAMQKHNDIANRTDIVKQINYSEAKKSHSKMKDLDTVPDLYPSLPGKEHRWGMAIDLDKCTGCSACMAACALENNVPQNGRDQVLLGREMHWIRLDRYFKGPVDNPKVTFQPMMCQQCNHAPCEAVCPVFATNRDPEGVNAMTYNRCVGTRYCANACPYKVRRFNWWTHKWNVMGERPQDRTPRALNPDVTVRTRGVMEKCNFCYQRVRDAKHQAKIRGGQLRDGEAKTACQETCPSSAITFGNLNDPRARVTVLRKDQRAYLALNGDPEHGHYGLKTMPNVSYLAEVTHEETT